MANQIFDIQISIPSSNPSPVNIGDKRLTAINLSRLLRAGLIGGNAPSLSGSGSYIQVQSSAVAASATATCAAVQSGDTVTIAGTALTATQKRASATVTLASAVAGQTVTINGVVFTAVNGAVVLGEATFDVSGTDTADATSLAAQVNAYASPLLSGLIAAKSSAAVVTLYAVTQGTAGNAFTLASSNGGTLAVSGATFANGAAVANNAFDFAGSNATTAAALAYAINNSTTSAIKQVTATANSSGVVTVTSKVAGLAGNTLTFVSSNGTRLAVTGSGFLASGTAGAVTRWSVG